MATHRIPAEPPGPVWDRHGRRWDRSDGEHHDRIARSTVWICEVGGLDDRITTWVPLLSVHGPVTDHPAERADWAALGLRGPAEEPLRRVAEEDA